MGCPVLTRGAVEAARALLSTDLPATPCVLSVPLSELTGARVWCKLDHLLRTGSFKERGARHALLKLEGAARRSGVIAASAGNHALGLAYHGHLLGIPVTVVMPDYAPLVKIETCRRLGAQVVLRGEDFGSATVHARELAGRTGATYVHGFDDPDIIAGAGVCGLEILEQVPDVEAVIVPVGGGGLSAGLALALEGAAHPVELYAVEPDHAACLQAATAAGDPVEVPVQATLADGLAVPKIGRLPWEVLRGRLAGNVVVTEDDLALAILRLAELEKAVVEGAGAAGLAALLSGRLAHLRGRTVVLPLCGGNIDPLVLGRVIERGLVADGRLSRFSTLISDRPGGLARFADAIAAAGASIREVVHDRAFSASRISQARVQVTLETRDRAHLEAVRGALAARGYLLSAEGVDAL